MKNILGVAILALAAFLLFYLNRSTDNRISTAVPDTEETVTEDSELSPLPNMNTAIISTNKGLIEIELFADLAPNTVTNFSQLAQSGFYNQVKFHRVIKGFMIQSGDPHSKDDEHMELWGTGGPGYRFEDEIHAENHNVAGSIAMANAGPNTNGSQFFINTADNDYLDTKHTVFGKVISGMDVVSAIENTETGLRDIPIEPIIIESIVIK